MSLPRGFTVRLSPMRRIMNTFLSFSRAVPLVAIERRFELAKLVDARQQLAQRPSWFAIFLKAYAQVAAEMPALRQSFLTFPWERIHQHACNVASITIVRQVEAEEGIFMAQIRAPETWPLRKLDQRIRDLRTMPLESVADFRRQLMIGKMPGWLRTLIWWLGLRVNGDWRARYFGTFGITGVAALGSTSLHLMSPLNSTLTFGVMEGEGQVMVRLFYDHRIMDGIGPAQALERLEEVLLTNIVHEMEEPTWEILPMQRQAA